MKIKSIIIKLKSYINLPKILFFQLIALLLTTQSAYCDTGDIFAPIKAPLETDFGPGSTLFWVAQIAAVIGGIYYSVTHGQNGGIGTVIKNCAISLVLINVLGNTFLK